MTKSTALAIIGKPSEAKAKDAKAEKVASGGNEKITPPVEVLHVHSALLLAAESTSAGDSARPYFGGVFLHRKEKVARVVASDGGRMFIGSFSLPSPMPSWLKDGILLSREGLKKRVQLIMGLQETPMIKLSHTKGSGFVEVSDQAGDAVFRLAKLPMEFPDYEKLIGAETFVSMDDEGNVTGREFEPVGINSRYLKHCGEIAKTLESGLSKKERPKNGMVVRAYSAKPDQPMFFSFDHWPGAVLLLAPNKLASAAMPKETAALMAGPIKLTLAALTAHETRNIKWAETAPTERARVEFMEKAAGFRQRINTIMGRVNMPSITEQKPEPVVVKPEPTREPQAEPTHDETPTEDSQPENQPEIKRTKIKISRKAAAA
jgi:hypothetical protein